MALPNDTKLKAMELTTKLVETMSSSYSAQKHELVTAAIEAIYKKITDLLEK